jgi:hypothetical protein
MTLTKLSMSGNNLIIPGLGNCQARLLHVLNTVGFLAVKTRKATPKELKRKKNQFLRRLPGKDYQCKNTSSQILAKNISC